MTEELGEDQRGVCAFCNDDQEIVTACEFGAEGNEVPETLSLCDTCRRQCVVRCYSCGQNFHEDDVTRFDDYDWCGACQRRHLTECSHCDDWCYTSRGCDCQDNDDDDRDGERAVDGIHPYSHKPYTYFHNVEGDHLEILTTGHQGSALYVGCELETETVNGSRADTLDAWLSSEFFYLKDDCSLTNGYEVVSHPATLQAWELLRADISQRFYTATSDGVRAWTRSHCGLHFHLSRASFTPAHTMRFHKFIMENAREMIGFAGRESSYGSFYSDVGKASDRAKGYSQPSRGCAINYYNDNTIELRFFRPTLDPDGFYGILQFVFAVHAYTKQLRARDLVTGEFPFRDFVVWLQGRDEYACALSRIVSRLSVKAVL